MVASNLVYRHNRITRLTHWLNALASMILLMSGLMIFNAHPHLYLGHTSEPDKALLSIGATERGGETHGYLEILGMKINTTGVLGVQRTANGTTQRAFPSWATVPGYYSLAGARRWHFFFGWLFSLTGLLYVVYNLAVGHMKKFLFTPADAARVPAMIAYYFKLRKDSPQLGEYNPLQKIAYTSVFLLLAPIILLSGMAMSPQLNLAFNWLPAMFGGRQSARTIHFVIAFGVLFFAFGHIFMVITQGFFNNMRSMITGWFREKVTHQDSTTITVTTEPLPPLTIESAAADPEPTVEASKNG
jgi:Ni/Fe-hydrogenase b-type cytochrome subunit